MLRVISVCLIFAFFLAACSSAEKNSDTPDGLFAIAQELEANDRYELAITRYTEVKNKFPYSSFATKAELAIADVHFKTEAWPEAQVSYQSFRELHPTHEKIDYVIYRIALSFYNQLPETVDRDLTLAKDAIMNFDEVIRRYPNSEFAKEAREKKEDCLKRLAGKEEYIAEFYYKRGFFLAALPRFEGVLRTYPGLGFDANALSKAAISAQKVDQKDKARRYLSALKQKFPGTPEFQAASKEID